VFVVFSNVGRCFYEAGQSLCGCPDLNQSPYQDHVTTHCSHMQWCQPKLVACVGVGAMVQKYFGHVVLILERGNVQRRRVWVFQVVVTACFKPSLDLLLTTKQTISFTAQSLLLHATVQQHSAMVGSSYMPNMEGVALAVLLSLALRCPRGQILSPWPCESSSWP